jgi:hypothetical protein
MVQHGLISEGQLREALERQPFTFKCVGEILVDMGAITRTDLKRMLELQHILRRTA